MVKCDFSSIIHLWKGREKIYFFRLVASFSSVLYSNERENKMAIFHFQLFFKKQSGLSKKSGLSHYFNNLIGLSSIKNHVGFIEISKKQSGLSLAESGPRFR